jgi:N4-gp56 family major capsid protein
MPNTTKYGDISDRTAGYAVKRLLQRGQPDMVTERFGQSDPHPANNSTVRKYRRYKSLAPAIAPLAEGVTPAGQKLRHEDVTINLEQYGDKVELSDVILDTHEDPVLQESIDLCGEQMAQTVELLRLFFLKGGTNVGYAAGVASRTLVNSPATAGDLRVAVRSLRRNKAEMISKIISATANVGTEPVGAAYFAIGHTDLASDLRDIAGFVPVENYSNHMKALPTEIGKVEDIRFVLTNQFEPWLAAGASGTTYLSNGVAVSGAAAADVYPLVILAKNAYGICPMQANKKTGYMPVTPAVVNPKPTHGDELAQRGFVSWKTWQGGGILNQLWVYRLEVACTANP